MRAPAEAVLPATVQRRLRARGVVQGVGFRPHVWRLASELGLAGWVRNDAAGVEILVEGEAQRVEAFTRRLREELPPLARLQELSWTDAAATGRPAGFAILASGAGPAATMIGHDTAVCPACLREMFDPADRRWRYAFINCTHCGPRYTLTRGLPYDRARTSMTAFPLCPDCEREYRDPANRRFHAEPTACPVCGPRLWLANPPAFGHPPYQGGIPPADAAPLTKGGAAQRRGDSDAVAETLSRLQAGQIVAIKGLGGFHLACDARDAAAVRRLRARKGREEKPFAVMAANVASVAQWVCIGEAERAVLESPERPIVLLRKRPGADQALPGIAPGLAWLGVMLPYTPLHWLLFHEAAGRPAGTAWLEAPQDLVLVMTSANPGGEPLVTGNDEALARLAGIADAVLLHDRDIVVRCDDSVVCLAAGPTPPSAPLVFIRRARGYTPRAIRLPRAGPPVLALGGQLKNTVCVTRGDEAYVSQHIGGLSDPATCGMLIEVTEHLLAILQVRPEVVVHDLHPDFFSTRHALELAGALGVPTLAVQHHHAHIAAVAAEHGVSGPLLGLALDGVGLGSDGSAWGGELLRVEGGRFARLGHLAALPLPGGDAAAREPWRMAAAVLHALGRGDEIARRFPGQPAAARLHDLLERGLNTPPTTSLGRWFDAAVGLLGVREVMAYEGQAAMLLEGLAEAVIPPPLRGDPLYPGGRTGRGSAPLIRGVAGGRGVCGTHHAPPPPDPAARSRAWPEALAGGWVLHPDGRLDLLPLLARLADERDAARGAALFHATLAEALAEWTLQAAGRSGLGTVALGGGCFLNRLLSERLQALLAERGLAVLSARQVPPNDAGLSLGQAWIAIQTLESGRLGGDCP